MSGTQPLTSAVEDKTDNQMKGKSADMADGSVDGILDDRSGPAHQMVVADEEEWSQWSDSILAEIDNIVRDQKKKKGRQRKVTAKESDPHIEIIDLFSSDDEIIYDEDSAVNPPKDSGPYKRKQTNKKVYPCFAKPLVELTEKHFNDENVVNKTIDEMSDPRQQGSGAQKPMDISSNDEVRVNVDSIVSPQRDSKELKSKRMKTIDSHLSSHMPKVRVNVENVVNKTNDKNILRPPQQEITREKYNIMVANYEKNLKYRDQCIEELQQKMNDKEKSEENLKQLLETKNELFLKLRSKMSIYSKSKFSRVSIVERQFINEFDSALAYGLENDTIPYNINEE